MNREERRRMLRKRKVLRNEIKEAAVRSVSQLETAFKKRWRDDESLNQGAVVDADDGEDESLNY